MSTQTISPVFNLNWPHAGGRPEATGLLRHLLEDFCVHEDLGIKPCGEGEHIYIQVKKIGENTDWIARQIASITGVKLMDVGYCGLKDRRAVTTQWFSVYLPKATENRVNELCAALTCDSVTVLTCGYHRKKLRRGEHVANEFQICLRDVSQGPEQVEPRLERIATDGVPNYFGDQRFGRDGQNLARASALLTGTKIHNRHQRSLALSAARSYLFNQVLSDRVQSGTWNQRLPGDVAQAEFPTGPMWGRGLSKASDQVLSIEQRVLDGWQDWLNALEHTGLTQERRSLVLMPEALTWRWDENSEPSEKGDKSSNRQRNLTLSFRLKPGCFATSVLREVVDAIPPMPSVSRS